LDAGQQRHLAEARARKEFPNLLLRGIHMGVANVNVERALDSDVERVSAPLTLSHDLFARLVREQADVGPDALTVRVVATLNYDFEIGSVFLLAVLFFEEFSGESEI